MIIVGWASECHSQPEIEALYAVPLKAVEIFTDAMDLVVTAFE